MKYLKELTPLFTAGIFFIGFLALLLTGFAYMLNPIKKDIACLEKRMDTLEAGQNEIKQMIQNLQTHSHKQASK